MGTEQWIESLETVPCDLSEIFTRAGKFSRNVESTSIFVLHRGDANSTISFYKITEDLFLTKLVYATKNSDVISCLESYGLSQFSRRYDPELTTTDIFYSFFDFSEEGEFSVLEHYAGGLVKTNRIFYEESFFYMELHCFFGAFCVGFYGQGITEISREQYSDIYRQKFSKSLLPIKINLVFEEILENDSETLSFLKLHFNNPVKNIAGIRFEDVPIEIV